MKLHSNIILNKQWYWILNLALSSAKAQFEVRVDLFPARMWVKGVIYCARPTDKTESTEAAQRNARWIWREGAGR